MLDQNGNPVTVKTGGGHLLTGTVEIQRDLPRSFGIATFFDFGNAFDKFGDPLEYSVGIGFRWRLPGRVPRHRYRATVVGNPALRRDSTSTSRRSCNRARDWDDRPRLPADRRSSAAGPIATTS